jgi:DNA-binding NtrC family response regulator
VSTPGPAAAVAAPAPAPAGGQDESRVAVVLVVDGATSGTLEARLRAACPGCEVTTVGAKDDLDAVVAAASERVKDAGRVAGSASAMLVDLADVPYAEAKRSLVALFDETYTGELLRRTGGNLSEAARRAGLDRSNFRRLLKRHRDEP